MSHDHRDAPYRLSRWLGGIAADLGAVVAPPSTTFRIPPDELVRSAGAAAFVNVMTEGNDDDGQPMLEGIWPRIARLALGGCRAF